MMSSFVKFLRPLMVTLLVMGSTLLVAQSTTDGAIGGTVYDTHGAVVANAKSHCSQQRNQRMKRPPLRMTPDTFA